MGKPKLELSEKDILQKIEMGNNVAAKLAKHAALPEAAPYLAALTAATTALTLANADAAAKRADADHADAVLLQQEQEFDAAMNDVAAYVDIESDGNTAIILSTGLDVRASNAPIGALPACENLAVLPGDEEAALTLKWKPVHGANSYEVHRSASAVGGYEFVCSCTKARVNVSGLAPGARYFFRVRAVGAAGPGPWSDVAQKIAA